MIYLIKSIYAWLLPPGIFIILILLLAVYLRRIKRSASLMAVCIALLLYIFSTEYVGGALIRSLESRYYPPLTVEADVIVLLGGGAVSDIENVGVRGHLQAGAAARTLTTARLAKLYGLPVLYTGGNTYDYGANEAQIVYKVLLDVGIAEQNIFTEEQSLNTTQSVRNIKPMLAQHGYKRPMVVTSAYHMPRSMLIFERNELVVTAYPTAYLADNRGRFDSRLLVPQVRGLEMTAIALREYLGMASLYVGYGRL